MKRIAKSRKSSMSLFEQLENRQLMSVSPFVINGTSGNDVIVASFGTNLVLSQDAVVQNTTTTTPVKVAKVTPTTVLTTRTGVGAAAPVNTTVVKTPVTTVQGTTTTGITIVRPPSIFNQLNYTINGVGHTAYLQPGQSIQINGLAGDDSITVHGKVNADIEGGDGNDVLYGGDGNDSINGGNGNDLIRAGTGNDFIHGNAGDDVIYGGKGISNAFGDDGNDRLYAGTGQINLYGGNGDDILVSIGGNAHDNQFGDAGNNSFWVGAGQLVLDATAAEAKTNVHRVLGYDALHVNGTYVGTPSLAMNVGNLPDPNSEDYGSTYAYKNFSFLPLFNTGNPVVADVNQGQAGDCYFMAVLEATAKTNPNIIKQSVVDLGDGTYAVDFKSGGKDHFIRVDADLPVYSNGSLAYAHAISQPTDLWVPILEKAFTFFRHGQGTYESINNGFPSEAFSDLGMNSSSYDPHHEGFFDLQSESPDEFANHVASLLAGGNEVTLCTPGDSAYLVESHCYMVDHVNYTNGKITSITLRNPWGHDGRGGDGVNDGYVTLTNLDVEQSIDLVTAGKPS